MKEIRLTQRKVALVDDEGFVYLSQWKWQAIKKGSRFYACRHINGSNTHILMHRVVLGLVPGDRILADHKNHNTLDNQRENLRKATHSQNSYNRLPKHTPSSRYKGVTFYKRDKIWQAQIQNGSKNIYLGCYKSESAAAKAYNEAAKMYFGEFACLNHI